ncbi:putative RNA-directed DNA polymerase from transposon BS [Araneus ventricosus]|uniref:Putative RNA-directed DNA polymerase from transposon BS n=1 Tax=Araneus ventricosus TaxID=182803 RepID=A0A4Y2UAQ0_ARAVE|nr:putative RNA-directed DNA polymerase from transposon BS [Araneus ventricosus]
MELNLIPEEQYGFRRGHSTIDQILYFAQSVRDAHNLKLTKHTISVFLDLTKAFDKVWKNKLLVKCHNEFNIRGRALPRIPNFLNNRSFRVKYQSSISSIYRSYQGTPQGSVMSPTLFFLFVAGMEKIVSSCNIGLFADDVVIWKNYKDVVKIENSLNENMVAIQSFAEEHKLNFNPAKSFTCIFTTNRHMFNLQPKIYLKVNLLETTKSPTYLGFTLDTEINCGKHIGKLVEKGKKRLQLLKLISGRDWGANSGTLRMTYTALIRPVLEYGYQVYQVASQTNLNKLERVQFSAARIITGLRSCCPKAIVLYEADFQPLSMRIRTNSAKYIAELQSLGSSNRTSKFILQWTSNQRLKKDSPVVFMWKRDLLDFNIEPCIPFSCLTPNTSLDRVSFNDQLLTRAPKHTQHPEMMRQLSLELINNIPSQALVLYTDGSKSDSGRTGSGVYAKAEDGLVFRCRFRNPDNCSVFRSELLAIREALNFALHFENSDIYILTDSKSSIQYLKNWPEIREKTGQEVISKIATLSQKSRVCFQWIPSHVGVFGNEEADVLAKEGSALPSATSSELFTSEIFSVHKAKANSA